ncbi:MAG: fluoride efflux transporter CrcB [Deinococcales bacterium]
MSLFYIALFGALGSLARYGVGVWARSLGVAFPYGTLIVNVAGCFILGFVSTLALEGRVSETVRLALAAGFCGAFTTFSTFELEVMNAVLEGRTWVAVLYVLLSLSLGFLAVFLGRFLALNL